MVKPLFAVGDRVEIITALFRGDVDMIGKRATVMESCDVPWLKLDEPLRSPLYSERLRNDLGIPEGHAYCTSERCLRLESDKVDNQEANQEASQAKEHQPNASEWDKFYMGLCSYVAEKSKDPSTKVGAVLVRPDFTVVSLGFNGFPRGVLDLPERYADRGQKYPRIVHAEVNAILNAREPLAGCTLYVSKLFPCASCAGIIIQSGVKEVVCSAFDVRADWRDTAQIAKEMFEEAGVVVRQLDS